VWAFCLQQQRCQWFLACEADHVVQPTKLGWCCRQSAPALRDMLCGNALSGDAAGQAPQVQLQLACHPVSQPLTLGAVSPALPAECCANGIMLGWDDWQYVVLDDLLVMCCTVLCVGPLVMRTILLGL